VAQSCNSNRIPVQKAGIKTLGSIIIPLIQPLPLLYCSHIERYENQPDDFNIHQLPGWRYSDMIIALAEKDRCPLYKA